VDNDYINRQIIHYFYAMITIKTFIFVCLLFCEFHDLVEVAKIMGHKYSKSHAIFM